MIPGKVSIDVRRLTAGVACSFIRLISVVVSLIGRFVYLWIDNGDRSMLSFGKFFRLYIVPSYIDTILAAALRIQARTI